MVQINEYSLNISQRSKSICHRPEIMSCNTATRRTDLAHDCRQYEKNRSSSPQMADTNLGHHLEGQHHERRNAAKKRMDNIEIVLKRMQRRWLGPLSRMDRSRIPKQSIQWIPVEEEEEDQERTGCRLQLTIYKTSPWFGMTRNTRRRTDWCGWDVLPDALEARGGTKQGCALGLDLARVSRLTYGLVSVSSRTSSAKSRSQSSGSRVSVSMVSGASLELRISIQITQQHLTHLNGSTNAGDQHKTRCVGRKVDRDSSNSYAMHMHYRTQRF